MLYRKLMSLKDDFEQLTKEHELVSDSSLEDRKASDEAIYEMKVILSRERAFHREQIVGYEN